MLKHIPRRQRSVIITAITGGVLLLVALLFFLIWSGGESTYIPGGNVEGLTSDLSRNLPENHPEMTFVDVAESAGIRFQHFPFNRTTQLPEDMGSGAAWGDYNNDGWLDLYVVNQSGTVDMVSGEMTGSSAHSRLYRNNGDGTFTEVSNEAGVAYFGIGMAAAWGDYDSDGWLDLLVTSYGRNVLYHNNRDGTFTDISERAGIVGWQGFWTGASWGDYDLDGHLDIYICGYVQYSDDHLGETTLQYETEMPASLNPSSFPPERNLLFRNQGDGTFTEVAVAAGVENQNGRSLSATWCDFDNDGLIDLYVANDVSDNVFFLNNGDGTFRDVSHMALVADYRGAMGIATSDWDNDLDFDMVITHWIAQENALYNNLLSQLDTLELSDANAIKFMDVADRYGLGQIALDFVGFGAAFSDFNNDGWEDLFMTNGSTMQQDENPLYLEPMPDQLFWNAGPEQGFFDISSLSGPGFEPEFVGRGAAIADYDNDGDQDIFVVNNHGPAQLLQNQRNLKNNWLTIILNSLQKNRSGIGAHLQLYTGEHVQFRQIGAQSSYLSQHSMRAHFGLGDTEQIDSLLIRWPDGKQQKITEIQTNQILTISKQ